MQQILDVSMGEDLKLNYSGPYPWSSTAPAVELEAE